MCVHVSLLGIFFLFPISPWDNLFFKLRPFFLSDPFWFPFQSCLKKTCLKVDCSILLLLISKVSHGHIHMSFNTVSLEVSSCMCALFLCVQLPLYQERSSFQEWHVFYQALSYVPPSLSTLVIDFTLAEYLTSRWSRCCKSPHSWGFPPCSMLLEKTARGGYNT